MFDSRCRNVFQILWNMVNLFSTESDTQEVLTPPKSTGVCNFILLPSFWIQSTQIWNLRGERKGNQHPSFINWSPQSVVLSADSLFLTHVHLATCPQMIFFVFPILLIVYLSLFSFFIKHQNSIFFSTFLLPSSFWVSFSCLFFNFVLFS